MTLKSDKYYDRKYVPFLEEELEQGEMSEDIYHYTSPGGLKGILENHSLWFNDIDQVPEYYIASFACNGDSSQVGEAYL